MKVYADGERREHVVIRNVYLGKYAERVVLENKCEALVEMRVVYDGDSTNIFYLTEGLETVGYTMRREPEFSFYRCVTEMLQAVTKAGEYLVSEEELVFDPEFMYVNPETGKIRLMYIPGNGDDISIREAIIDLADLWLAGGNLTEQEMESIIAYKKDIFYKDYGIRELTRITEDASRALFAAGTGEAGLTENGNCGESDRDEEADPDAELLRGGECLKLRNSVGHKIMDFLSELVS